MIWKTSVINKRCVRPVFCACTDYRHYERFYQEVKLHPHCTRFYWCVHTLVKSNNGKCIATRRKTISLFLLNETSCRTVFNQSCCMDKYSHKETIAMQYWAVHGFPILVLYQSLSSTSEGLMKLWHCILLQY